MCTFWPYLEEFSKQDAGLRDVVIDNFGILLANAILDAFCKVAVSILSLQMLLEPQGVIVGNSAIDEGW